MTPTIPRGAAANFKHDGPASLVVFLVAVPLCLGIALASGAPLFSGVIAGIIGGLVVGAASGSQVGVSGPAAGLAVIVLSAIESLGAFDIFLMAVVLSGVIQMAMGFARAGVVGYYVPSSVIKGMLAGIGIIIFLKQIPHAFGYDADPMGDDAFLQADGENTFSEIMNVFGRIHPAALVVSALGLGILILWETKALKRIKALSLVPGPLVAVTVGVVIAVLTAGTAWGFRPDQMVSIPVAKTFAEFQGLISFPDFAAVANPAVWVTAATLAVVASLETLLSVEASDKLDVYKRVTPTNRELKAQGLGNMCSGLIGGLPVTQVIVRTSANVQAGGRTKWSAVYHGILLLVSVLAFPFVLNLIPLSALAAVLLLVGYKLAKPATAIAAYKRGWTYFIPFAITVLGIVFVDLLVGIGLGLAVSTVTVLYQQWLTPYKVGDDGEGAPVRLVLAENVSFFNKAPLQHALEAIPTGGSVIVDAREAAHVDLDVVEMLDDYHATAAARGVDYDVIGDLTGTVVPAPDVLKKTVERRVATSLRGDGAVPPVTNPSSN